MMATQKHSQKGIRKVKNITDEEILSLYYDDHWFKHQICSKKHVGPVRVRQVIRDAETGY